MEKVLFVKTSIPKLKNDALEPDMGLLYVATYVKNHCNVIVKYVDLSVDSQVTLLKEAVDASVFCFSTFTANYELTLETKKLVDCKGICIAGGHHATALPQDVAKDFNYVVTGEGEIAMAELISNLVKGIYPDSKIIEGKFIENLDEIEDIDYDLIDITKYSRVVNGKKSMSILTSRGCPYGCEFCNSTLSKDGQRVRFKSAEKVINEIKNLNMKYEINAFRIQDDIFSINKERLHKIANAMESKKIDFRCFARIDSISNELLDDFVRMGIKHISFGIESGSQKILDLMNKGLKVNDIKKNFKLVKERGIITRMFLIVGYPGETFETINETIDLVKECMPHEISIYPLIPYPGTPLFANPKKYNISYIDKNFSKYYQVFGEKECGYVFETEDCKIEDIKYMRDYLVSSIEPYTRWAIDAKEFE